MDIKHEEVKEKFVQGRQAQEEPQGQETGPGGCTAIAGTTVRHCSCSTCTTRSTFLCTFRTRIGIAAKRVISRHFDTDASDVTSACSGKCHVPVADDEYSGRCCPAAYH
uniref:Uncharacterized protein n=1 Tax=Anopheles melas TaxID=34690 RepID=A0A182UAV0_9DIPT